MIDLLLVAGVVFGVNLPPAFGPPTWAVLVFFSLNRGVPAVPLVLVGAIAAAAGRLVLAHASGRFRGRLSPRYIANLDAAREALVGGRGRALAALGLFALSPLPSAQLFVAAGLVQAPLLPLTAAFFAGRLVSYSLYVAAANAVEASLGSVLSDALGSPIGIALQVVFLAGLVALVRIDWARVLRGRRRDRTSPVRAGARRGGRRPASPSA